MTTKGRRAGWLVLADISGYTSFLTGTELEHAHEILEDLMRGIMAAMQKPLRLVKLEGDAVFAYAPAEDVADGRTIVDRLEDCYHGFRMQLFNTARSSTCTCSACKSATTLDLKFMVHYGEYLVHDLAGHDDLQGPDVILVHRLLKNEVAEKTGKRAYLLVTEAARARVQGVAWAEHEESYEHIGAVKCGTRDLHAAFDELTESGAADVKAGEEDFGASFEVTAPCPIAWEWHMDGEKVLRWQIGINGWRIDANEDGRVRPGAMVHCSHGKASKDMRILGWRPYRSATFDAPAMGLMSPPVKMTMSFTPTERGTRVDWRFRITKRTLVNRLVGWLLSKLAPGVFVKMGRKLENVLAEEGTRETIPAVAPSELQGTAAA